VDFMLIRSETTKNILKIETTGYKAVKNVH